MNDVRKWQLLFFCALSLAVGRTCAASSIVGDTVDIYGVAQLNGSETLRDTVVVVDPGIEYTAVIIDPIYELNIGPASITLNSVAGWFSPWFNSGNPPTTLEIRDINVPGMPGQSIGGVSVIYSETIVPHDSAPVNYPDFSESNVTFTPNSVILQTGPYLFPTGSRVQIDLTFVPEPSTVLLFLTGSVLALRSRQTCPRNKTV